jgi:hypothetical protein
LAEADTARCRRHRRKKDPQKRMLCLSASPRASVAPRSSSQTPAHLESGSLRSCRAGRQAARGPVRVWLPRVAVRLEAHNCRPLHGCRAGACRGRWSARTTAPRFRRWLDIAWRKEFGSADLMPYAYSRRNRPSRRWRLSPSRVQVFATLQVHDHSTSRLQAVPRARPQPGSCTGDRARSPPPRQIVESSFDISPERTLFGAQSRLVGSAGRCRRSLGCHQRFDRRRDQRLALGAST